MHRIDMTALLLSTLYLDYIEEIGDDDPQEFMFGYDDLSTFYSVLRLNKKVKVTVEIINT